MADPISPDGSTLTPLQGGTLVANSGTFGFTSLVTGTVGDDILLNGQDTHGYGVELLVANDGNLYDWTNGFGWYEWTASGFVATSGPTIPLLQVTPDIIENASATALQIAAPTDTNAGLDSALVVTIDAVPSGLGTVFNGGAVVSVGTELTPAQLAALTFQPASGTVGTGFLSYTVTDGQLSVPEPAVVITVSASHPVLSYAAETTPLAVENTSATPIAIPAPTDPIYPTAALSAAIVSLPSDGTVLVTGGGGTASAYVGETLSIAELTSGLSFEASSGASQASVLWYSVTNPAGGTTIGYTSLIPPVLTTPTAMTVATDSEATPIVIPAPQAIEFPATQQPYTYYPASQLSVRIDQLPDDGTVLLVSGGTTSPVSVGEVLTVGELTGTFSGGQLVSGLEFVPTAGSADESGTLVYTVSSPVASGVGSATLSIGQAAALWQDPNAGPTAGSIAAPPSIPQPAEIGSGIVGVDLQNTSATGQSGYVTFGQVFRDGDVASGTALFAEVVSGGSVVGAPIPVQMSVETTYADGSVDDAILTLSAPMISAGGTLDLLLVSGGGATSAAPIGAATMLDDLLANGDVVVTIALSGGAISTVSASQVLAAAINGGGIAQDLWMSGPQASEYVVSTTVDGGALEIEFDITAYANGATTTDVIFSTALTSIISAASAPPTAPNVVYTARISEGGTTVYTTPISGGTPVYVQQYPYSEWDDLVYSSQTINPNVQYDLQYLEATGAIQNYDTTFGASAAAITANLTALNPGNTGCSAVPARWAPPM